MPKIPLSCHQYRQHIGNHTNRQDRQQKSQKYQDHYIQQLAHFPGRHTENIRRQDRAYAMLQLVAVLSSVRNCSLNPVGTPQCTNDRKTVGCQLAADTGYGLSVLKNVININHDVKQVLKPGAEPLPGKAPLSGTVVNSVSAGLTAMWHSVTHGVYKSSQFIFRNDPLKFPEASGFDIDSNNINVKGYYPRRSGKGAGYDFIDSARSLLADYFNHYDEKYPPLQSLARSVLKEEIQSRFHLELDPDRVRFLHFDNTAYMGGDKVHYAPARENKTLTEWLFTNFDAETQDNLQDMDAMCGLYATAADRKIYRAADEIPITPTDFILLVYDINFYNYAKNKLTAAFKDKDVHIKKYFLDFINHLDSSDMANDAAGDVLCGAGISEGRKIQTSLFDINGYFAATAFIFRNKYQGRTTLYFPESDFKFISFRSDFEMREWVAGACATKAHREMIASHFTVANRQDGVFYSGVDSWLKAINPDAYYDKIAGRLKDVNQENFFEFLFHQIKEKTFSDLDSFVRSDAEIRRDMWEEMIDASNIVPNPVSPFLSLGMHLEHALEADTCEEKQQEWNKITSDVVNIVAMATLTTMSNFLTQEGYDFIRIVSKKIRTTAAEETEHILKTNDVAGILSAMDLSPSTSESKPRASFWRWLSDDNQPGHTLIQEVGPLEKFLPLPELTKFTVTQMDNIFMEDIKRFLGNHPCGVYYGFADSDRVPQYIRNKRALIIMHLKYAKDALDNAYYRLMNLAVYKNIISHYLSQSLGTQNKDIINEAIKRLTLQVDRARRFFDESEQRQFNNIAIVSTRQTPNPDNPLEFDSLIADKMQRKKIPFAVSSFYDPFRRIFIYNDAFSDIVPDGFNEFGVQPNAKDRLILHEASHIATYTEDYYYNSYDITGSQFGGPDILLNHFNKLLRTGDLKFSRDFTFFMKRAYLHLNIVEEFDKNRALIMLQRDPMMQANMMINNADNFVVYVNDIANFNDAGRAKRSSKEVTLRMRYLRSLLGIVQYNLIK